MRSRVALAFLWLYEWVLARLGRTPDYGILELEIEGALAEHPGDSGFAPWLRPPARDFLGLLSTLRWAAEDPRLRGVLIRCRGIDASWARLQGLRRSLAALRAAGKKVWIHTDGAGLPEYYLASAADRISLTPAGSLDVVGLASESMFFLDALESLGARAEVVHVGAYKAAGEMFTRREMSAEHREMMESIIDDLYTQIVDDIAADRGIGSAGVRDAIDHGPLLSAEALERQLIDAVEYADEAQAALVKSLSDAATIEEADYVPRRMRAIRKRLLRAPRRHMAIVHVDGTIQVDGGDPAPWARRRGATSSELAKSFEEIRERDDIESVVVRVSSPGGSGLASDLIWREMSRTAADKPLFVSFGDVAASGGYYVAMAGRKVFAEPGTLTGSIGVVAGKANLKGVYEKVGINKEIVSRGRHAALYSDYAPLGGGERERIQAEASKFYEDFVAKVAAGRRMPAPEVDKVAQGRVWTGRQALSRGLIDELGGFEEAIAEAKRAIGVAVDRPVTVERFPKPQTPWLLALGRRFGGMSLRLDPLALLPDPARLVVRERVWAVLPFRIRIR